jgi:hypothetical protein
MESEIAYFARTPKRNPDGETHKLREAVVWDAENNRVLAEFDKQGLFETSDERTIGILTKLGYKRVTLEQIRGRHKLTPSELAKYNHKNAHLAYETVQDPALLEQLRQRDADLSLRYDDFSDMDDLEDNEQSTPPSRTKKTSRSRRSVVK